MLDGVSPEAEVTIQELVPELVDWNRRYLGRLADHPLADPRCRVIVGDVFDTLNRSFATFDVILLDVDTGPQRLTQAKNQRLYGEGGIRACLAALRPGGILAVWSSAPNARYQRGLEKRAAEVEVLSVPARIGSKLQHIVFVAKRPGRAGRVARGGLRAKTKAWARRDVVTAAVSGRPARPRASSVARGWAVPSRPPP